MKLRQKGFTLIEGLLIIIALTMVMGVGYYVYSQNRALESSSPAKTTDTPLRKTDKTTPSEDEFAEFKDLGFRIKKTETMADWMFIANEDFPGGRYVQSKAHVEAIDKCNVGAANPPLGISPSEKSFAGFSRIEGTYVDDPTVITGRLMKQFDAFHIVVNYPNGGSPCFNEQGVGYPVLRSPEGAHQELEEALKNAEEL